MFLFLKLIAIRNCNIVSQYMKKITWYIFFQIIPSYFSGETDGNAKHLLQGHTDTPLNENGRQQARKAGQWLKDQKYDQVYASDLSRAFETATIIVQNNTYMTDDDAKNIKKDTLLRERYFGVFEDRPVLELGAAEEASGKGFGHVSVAIGALFKSDHRWKTSRTNVASLPSTY